MLKKCIILMLAAVMCAFAVSCSNNADDLPDNTAAERVPDTKKITPQSYAEGDLAYDLEISDGGRSVCLKVSRSGSVTEAQITSPSALSGVGIVWDGGGMRIILESGEELALTEDGAAGMRAFFEAMAHVLSGDEKKAEGMYRFELSGYEAELLLSEDGYPRLVSLTKDGHTRHGEVTFPGVNGTTS